MPNRPSPRLFIERSPAVDVSTLESEIVERKGIGHPDTLADGIAESISRSYSEFCLERFGVILRHRADKVTITGGKTVVSFGHGEFLEPMRVLLCGSICSKFANQTIDTDEIAEKATLIYLKSVLNRVDTRKHVKILNFMGNSPSPGRNESWFSPTGPGDLPELRAPRANDTASVSAYAPLSELERIVLSSERWINGPDGKKRFAMTGTDVKVMGVRNGRNVDLTIAVPFIASDTPDVEAYEAWKRGIEASILELAKDVSPTFEIHVSVNNRDDRNSGSYYLTVVGTSAESGDQGQVGRGNRSNGLISTMRPMNVEAYAGKSPVYHVGKVYAVLTQAIADRIYEETGLRNDASVVARTGDDLHQPRQIIIRLAKPSRSIQESRIKTIVTEELENIQTYTGKIIEGELLTANLPIGIKAESVLPQRPSA